MYKLIVLIGIGLIHAISLEEAFDLALQNNLSIAQYEMVIEQARRSASIQNSDMLPRLSLTGSTSYRNEERSDERIPASVSLNISYTLFDGFFNLNRYRAAQERALISEIHGMNRAESIVLKTAEVYLSLQQAKRNLSIAEKGVELSKMRLELAKDRVAYGQALSHEITLAETDLFRDKTAKADRDDQLRQKQIELAQLIGLPSFENLIPNYEIELNPLPPLETLLEDALEKNRIITVMRHETTVAELENRAARSALFPRINLTGGYGYQNSDLPNNDFLWNYNATAQLNWNIYDGRARTAIEISKLKRSQQEISINEESQDLQAQIKRLHISWQGDLRRIEREQQSQKLAQTLLNRSQELYKQGQINSTELRESQINLTRARLNYEEAKTSAKIRELQLRQITGNL